MHILELCRAACKYAARSWPFDRDSLYIILAYNRATAYQSANPTIFPSHAHQISSSSSSISASTPPSSPCSSIPAWPAVRCARSNADPPRQPTHTPSVRTPARGFPFPCPLPVARSWDGTARASSSAAASAVSSARVRFWRAAQAGCANRRGARRKMCVWVGAVGARTGQLRAHRDAGGKERKKEKNTKKQKQIGRAHV